MTSAAIQSDLSSSKSSSWVHAPPCFSQWLHASQGWKLLPRKWKSEVEISAPTAPRQPWNACSREKEAVALARAAADAEDAEGSHGRSRGP